MSGIHDIVPNNRWRTYYFGYKQINSVSKLIRNKETTNLTAEDIQISVKS